MRRSVIGLLVCAAQACGGDLPVPTEARFQLELVGRYGSVSGPLALQPIRNLSLDPGRERVYVSQGGSALVLSLDGDSVGVIGKPGDGPGELRSQGRVVVRGDTLWVPDSDGTVEGFGPSGEYLGGLGPYRDPLPGTPRMPLFVGFLVDGSIVLEGGISMNEAASGRQRDVPLITADRAGTPKQALGDRRLNDSFFIAAPNGERVVIGQHPAPSWDLHCLDPAGRWLVLARQRLGNGGPPSLDVVWIDGSGDTLRAIAVALPPVGIERARARFVEEFRDFSGLPTGRVEEIADQALTWPRFMPATEIVCDHDGRTWIQLPHLHPDSAIWALHDEQGGPVGRTTLPARVRLQASVGDQVWGWAPGGYDEPYVLRFRLAAEAR